MRADTRIETNEHAQIASIITGQGLVAVLHGPPGTGKILTAEGIAEMLKKPLYVSIFVSKFSGD